MMMDATYFYETPADFKRSTRRYMDLRCDEIGWEGIDWMQLAQDRDQWTFGPH
jgi:hypothetical protein